MRKLIAILMSSLLCMGLLFVSESSVKAAEEKNEMVSEMEAGSDSGITPYGIYYQSGSSTISKAGTGLISAGGTTIGQSVVSTISITVRVERKVNGSWQSYTSWTATNYNAASVHTSKTMSVPTGYYYRTYSTHRANTDVSGSVSGGVYI